MNGRPTPGKVVTRVDLERKVHNLNVKHDLDAGDPGFLNLQTWRNNHSTKYRVTSTRTGKQFLIVTQWMRGSELLDHLRTKDWKRVLMVCRGEAKKWDE